MLESANRYAVTSREFIRRAQQYLAVEDLHQASEKGVGRSGRNGEGRGRRARLAA